MDLLLGCSSVEQVQCKAHYNWKGCHSKLMMVNWENFNMQEHMGSSQYSIEWTGLLCPLFIKLQLKYSFTILTQEQLAKVWMDCFYQDTAYNFRTLISSKGWILITHLALFPAFPEDLPVVFVAGIMKAKKSTITQPRVGSVWIQHV